MKPIKKCKCQDLQFNAVDAYYSLQRNILELTQVVKELAEDGSVLSERSVGSSVYDKIKRIIGGEEVDEGEFPECCLIGRYIEGGFEWMCTGVLIDKRIVVTAGHCFTPFTQYEVALNCISQNAMKNAERIKVRKGILHPKYDHRTFINDIAVLILEKEAVSTRPIEIATTFEINNCTNTQLVGFGTNTPLGNIGFGIKREVTVPVISIRRLADDDLSFDEYKYGFESDLEFVAGGDGYDSCKGDSGGPAYIYVSGSLKVAGITSRATKNRRHECGEGGIYSRLDVHLDFIFSMLEKYQ